MFFSVVLKTIVLIYASCRGIHLHDSISPKPHVSYHIMNIKQGIMIRHETSVYKYASCCIMSHKSWPCDKCGLFTLHSQLGDYFLFSVHVDDDRQK